LRKPAPVYRVRRWISYVTWVTAFDLSCALITFERFGDIRFCE